MAQLPLEMKLFDLMHDMVLEMVETIEEDQFDTPPSGGGNSPNWIFGHLTLVMDFGASLLDQPAESIDDMMPLYGPGSPGGKVGAEGMSKDALMTRFRQGANRLREAVAAVDESVLARPQSSPFLTEELPTVGDMLGHVLTTHFALHIGQISAWRRQNDLPSILRI